MRLLINAMAVAGFAMSTSVVAAVAIFWTQFETIKQKAIETATQQAMESVTKQLTKQLDGKFDGMVDALPKKTGPALPF